MKQTLMKAMTASISEVMETMFFLPVEIIPETNFKDSGIGKQKAIACQLTFTGDVSGQLNIISPRDLAAQMAENFMGEPKEHLTEDHLSGTLAEMLNMVCGNALKKITSRVPYELGLPEWTFTFDPTAQPKCALIKTDELCMAVFLTVTGS